MPLALGAILFFALLLLLQGSGKGKSTRRASHVLVGSLVVGAVAFLSVRSGMPLLGIAAVLLFMGWQRFPSRRAGGGASGHGADALFDRGSGRMTRQEALEVLGLDGSATRDQILAEYRRLMKKVHPDLGGTTYLATRLNRAKDVLLGDDSPG